MGEERTVHRVLVGNLKEGDHRGYREVDGKKILTFWAPEFCFFNF
jgi:hypothetical protein